VADVQATHQSKTAKQQDEFEQQQFKADDVEQQTSKRSAQRAEVTRQEIGKASTAHAVRRFFYERL